MVERAQRRTGTRETGTVQGDEGDAERADDELARGRQRKVESEREGKGRRRRAVI